jgi:hypothetical protein
VFSSSSVCTHPKRRKTQSNERVSEDSHSYVAVSKTIRLALRGVREGLADPRAGHSVFAGVAPFADYTTQPEEWAAYRVLWLNDAR